MSIIEYSDIINFPGYRVDSIGNVWTCWTSAGRGKGKKLGTQWVKKSFEIVNGYFRVTLYNNQGSIKFFVHRLILETFVGPCPQGMEACHKDGNRQNNQLNNLRWDTPENNWKDRREHGRDCDGIKSPHAKLTAEAVKDIRESRLKGVRLQELAKRYNVSMAKISQVALKKNWKHI
jgi:hypothetical protein